MKINKTLKISLTALLVIDLILIIGLFLFFKPILQYGLKSANLSYITLEDASFRFSGTTLKNVRINGSENILGEVGIYATYTDIKLKQVGRVVIKNAKINPLTILPPKAEGGSKAINLYAKNIEFENAEIAVATPFGTLPVLMTGILTDKGDIYEVTSSVSGTADFAEIAGQLTVKITKTTGDISAHLELAEARANLPTVEMKRLAGWISADLKSGTPLPSINAQLTAGSLKIYGLPLQGTTLTASSTADKIQLLLSGQVQNGSGDINADITLDKTGTTDKLSAKIDTNLKNLDALGLADMTGQGSFNLLASGEKEKTAELGDLAQWKNLKGFASVIAQKLSLRGLFGKAAASGKLEMDFDPALQLLSVKTFDGPFTFKGIVQPIDAVKPVAINIPQGILAWDAKQKSLKTVLIDADLAATLFTAKKATTDLTVWLGGGAPVLEGKITVGEIAQTAQPPYIIPLRLSVQFVPLSSAQNTTGFTGDVSEKNGLLYAKFDGKHNIAANKGDISISMPPVKFIQGVTTPAQVFPFLSVYIPDAYGTLGLSAKASWAKNVNKWQTTTSGELYLKSFTATYDGNTVTDVNTVLKLDSLTPPQFRNQTVSVGELFVGLPLTNGVIEVSMDAKKNLSQTRGVWDLAGGKVGASPFTLPLDTMETDVTLTASGLDLGQLFNIAPTEGLVATGTVNGNFPVSVRKDSISITNGVLETSGTGTISYAVESMPAFLKDTTSKQIIDLRTALAQFHYDSLRMVMNGVAGGNQNIQLQIKGKNPLFYNGKPVNFNLNLDGPLQNVLKYKPGGGRIPDSIRNQLEAYEKQHGK